MDMDQEVREKLDVILKRVVKQYEFFPFSTLEITSCFHEALLFARKDKQMGAELLEEQLHVQFKRIIREKLRSYSKFLEFFSRVCSQYLEVKFSKEEALVQLRKLVDICDFFSLFPEQKNLKELICDNSNLEKLLQVLVESQENRDKLDLLQITRQEHILSLLKAYCDLNHIECFEKRYMGMDGTQIYLENAKQDLLSFEEEKKYALRVLEGDKEAKMILWERNLFLVLSVANRFKGRGISFDDLIQEGNLALMKAIEEFDVRKGNRLSTYAVWGIRRAMLRAIAKQTSDIELSSYAGEKLQKYRKKSAELSAQLNRRPTLSEIAEQMKMSENKLQRFLQIVLPMERLNQNVDLSEKKEKLELYEIDSFSMENQMVQNDFQIKFLMQTKECLKEREFEVLKYRFGLCGENLKTQEEIAEIFNLTHQRIAQIEKKALQKLRDSSKMQSFINYLDYPEEAYQRIKQK